MQIADLLEIADFRRRTMIPRRHVLGGALAGGVLGALTEPEVEAAAQSSDRVDLAPIVRALNDLRGEVRVQRQFVEIATLREAQLVFLRSNGKLPDYIDVGTEHWFSAHDWHIRWQQPLNVSRDASGRLTLVLMSTLLILRPEAQPNYMSLPYDNRA
jgi:hypothetical protein